METLKTIWDFFQNEILGMAWLNRLIGSLLNALGLDTNEKIGGSVQFFIYDILIPQSSQFQNHKKQRNYRAFPFFYNAPMIHPMGEME